MIVYDGDLIVAGTFDRMDGMPARGVARWNGSRWQPLGSGPAFPYSVHVLEEYRGDLVAAGGEGAGDGDPAGCIAAWDGTSWRPLGSGIGGDYADIYGLAVHGDQLVVCGHFDRAGDRPARWVASWDGTTWNSMDPDTLFGEYASISDLAEYEGTLYAAGGFLLAPTDTTGNIARWNGSRWEIAGGGTNGRIGSLRVARGLLVAGGSFSRAGDAAASGIAAWNGSTWAPLGAGFRSFGHPAWVQTMIEIDAGLVAAGDFDSSGTVAVNGIAIWDGTSWANIEPALGGQSDRIDTYALAWYQNRLVAGGDFDLQGSVRSHHFAAWDGVRWATFGEPPACRLIDMPSAFLSTDAGLVAAATFSDPESLRSRTGVGRWDGSTWDFLGTVDGGSIQTLAEYHGRIVAAGSFEGMGGVAASNIASWDGSSWSALGTGVSGGVEGMVSDLAVYDDRLVAAGRFQVAGGRILNRVAQWDGNSWTPLGLGLWGVPATGSGLASVADLEVYDGRLVACGHFAHGDYEDVPALAAWDGVSWKALTGNLWFDGVEDPWLTGMTTWNGQLVVMGDSVRTGCSGGRNEKLALWDGTTWKRLQFLDGDVTRIGTHAGRLIVGGNFETPEGPREPSCIFQWDGERWYRMGAGVWSGSLNSSMGPGVTALATWNGSLYVGGNFRAAGNNSSPYIARWDGQAYRSALRSLSLAVGPNPAANALSASFYLSEPGNVRAVLFDAFGHRVATLARGFSGGGARTESWALRDDRDQALPSGIYFLHLDTEHGSAARKITILR